MSTSLTQTSRGICPSERTVGSVVFRQDLHDDARLGWPGRRPPIEAVLGRGEISANGRYSQHSLYIIHQLVSGFWVLAIRLESPQTSWPASFGGGLYSAHSVSQTCCKCFTSSITRSNRSQHAINHNIISLPIKTRNSKQMNRSSWTLPNKYLHGKTICNDKPKHIFEMF